jgi:hypothetical protein
MTPKKPDKHVIIRHELVEISVSNDDIFHIGRRALSTDGSSLSHGHTTLSTLLP